MEFSYIYIKILDDDGGDIPIVSISEIDTSRYETRRICIYRDGRVKYAPIVSSSGDDFLCDQPMPSIEALRSEGYFKVASINRSEFEKMWEKYIVNRQVYVGPEISLDFGENGTN